MVGESRLFERGYEFWGKMQKRSLELVWWMKNDIIFLVKYGISLIITRREDFFLNCKFRSNPAGW